MRFYWLVLGSLCVWRITYFLRAEDGPWDLSVRLRALAGQGFFGKLLDCFYCLSVWVAAPLAWWLGESWRERAFLLPSLSAAAILLERWTNPTPAIPPAVYHEEPFPEETDHGVLRTEKDPDGTAGPGAPGG